MIVNCYLPFTLPANSYFRLLWKKSQAKMETASRTTIVNKYLPICTRIVKDYVKQQLQNRTACLIIDEMSKSGKSFYNILLSTVDDSCGSGTNGIRIYFWDCKRLISNESKSVGLLIANTIRSLEEINATVNSYASDNCPAMIHALQYAEAILNRHLDRVPCASHIVNLFFKDLLDQESIKKTWILVDISWP